MIMNNPLYKHNDIKLLRSILVIKLINNISIKLLKLKQINDGFVIIVYPSFLTSKLIRHTINVIIIKNIGKITDNITNSGFVDGILLVFFN